MDEIDVVLNFRRDKIIELEAQVERLKAALSKSGREWTIKIDDAGVVSDVDGPILKPNEVITVIEI